MQSWRWLSSSNLSKMIFWNPFCHVCPLYHSWRSISDPRVQKIPHSVVIGKRVFIFILSGYGRKGTPARRWNLVQEGMWWLWWLWSCCLEKASCFEIFSKIFPNTWPGRSSRLNDVSSRCPEYNFEFSFLPLVFSSWSNFSRSSMTTLLVLVPTAQHFCHSYESNPSTTDEERSGLFEVISC